MTQFIMQKKFVDDLKDLVMKKKVEYCGNLISDNSSYYLLDPIWEGGEGVCNFKEEKMDEFFHTHPSTSKSYPSYQDINSIVKKRKMSIIASYWGIWFIYKTDRQTNYDGIDYGFIQTYKEYNEIFHQETTNLKGSYPRSIEYNKDVKKRIDEFITKMNRILEKYCTLKFVSWGDITHEVYQ